MENNNIDWGNNFQTPINICKYMVSFLPKDKELSVLEPTPGKGNLVKELKNYSKNIIVHETENFDNINLNINYFDYIVMNPPFSPMKQGYEILYKCMNLTNNIIALMPYLTIINGEKRTNDIMDYGLKSITHLPRSTFKGSRVQTCILEMEKFYKGNTIFKLLPKNL